MTSSIPEEGKFHYQSKTGSYHYVKKTGYLVKSPSNRIGRWRKRWFMLVDSVEPGQLTGTPERQIRLEYYSVAPLKIKNLRELPKRKGMVDLRSCIAVVASDDKIKGYKYVMNIVMSSFRVHHLAATTKEELDEWILALNEFVFSKTKEAQNYFTRSKVKTTVYTDFITSTHYNRSKDDQFLDSLTQEESPVRMSNAEPDGEGPPPILISRNRCSLKRTLSRHAMLTDEEKRKSLKRKQATAAHEDPEETDGLLHIQLSNWNMTVISRESIRIGDTISSGDSKRTSHGQWKDTLGEEQKVVVKSALRDPTSIMKEGLTIWQLMHPNIIVLIGTVLIGNPKHIVLEFCEKGTLLEALQEHGKILEKGAIKSSELKPTLLNYCKQVSFGLSYLKSKEISHGAVKASNVLVTSEDICKISGFGESLSLKDGRSSSQTHDVPIEWTAPEAHSSKNYTLANDIWSLGIVLYEIWSLGCHPYQSLQKEEILPRLEEKYRLPPPPGVSKDIYRLMIELWHPDPEKRPAIDTVTTFLIQPQEDLLHMNQLPRNSSQQTHSAHTLGAPISSGEILYRDLQLTYSGFLEQAEAVVAPQQENEKEKRISQESCTYIDINELHVRHHLRKALSKGDIREEEGEEDLYWNDLYWKNSTGTQQNSDDFSPPQSSQGSILDESDIYWNDTLLPPASSNLFTNCDHIEEEDSNKADQTPQSMQAALLDPILHSNSLNLWDMAKKSSSEEESEEDNILSPRREWQGRRPDGARNLSIPKATVFSKDLCSSCPSLLTGEVDTSHSYYNSAAAEMMMENASRINDSPRSIMSPPKQDPASQFLPSNSSSKACNVMYTNLEAMKEEEEACLVDPVGDNHKYYNSTAAEMHVLISPPHHKPKHSHQGICDLHTRTSLPVLPGLKHSGSPPSEYYNSSAASLDDFDDEGNVSEKKEIYYNAAALSERIHQTEEDTHVYSPTQLGHCPVSQAMAASCETTPSYYNSSASELFGQEGSKDNPDSLGLNIGGKPCRSKSMPHYYNLDILDIEMLIAEENAQKQSLHQPVQPQEKTEPRHHTYYNLDILLPDDQLGVTADDERTNELEDSSREDVLELLRVRALKARRDLHAHIYRNLDNNVSRNVREDQSGPTAIVQVAPSNGGDRIQGQWPSTQISQRSIGVSSNSKETTRHVAGKLQGNADVIQEHFEDEVWLSSRATFSKSYDRNDSRNRGADKSGKKPVPNKKPAQLHSHQNHIPAGGVSSPAFNKPSSGISPSHSPRMTPSPSPLWSPSPSPMFSPIPSPLISPGPSPLVSPSPSPSPSPSFNSSKRRANVSDSTASNPARRILVPHKSTPNNPSKFRKGSKEETDVETNLEQEDSVPIDISDNPSLAENMTRKFDHKQLGKTFSNPNVTRMKNEEAQVSGHKEIKSQLSKVLSNPNTPPPSSMKSRPLPLPKRAVVASSTVKSKPPIAKRKPALQGSSSLTSFGSIKSNPPPKTVPNKSLQSISSELPVGHWQQQAKKPILPPVVNRNERGGGEAASTYLVKDNFVTT